MVLERFFFCPPEMSLTAVDVVEMAVTEDAQPEEGGSAAAGIDVERSDSAACMMLCDDNVAPVEFSDKRERYTRQERMSTCLDGDKTELVLGPLSSVM